MPAAVTNHGTYNQCLLPLVLRIHLGHRDIELAMQPCHQRLDPSTLLFQGSAARQMQVDRKGRNHRKENLDGCCQKLKGLLHGLVTRIAKFERDLLQRRKLLKPRKQSIPIDDPLADGHAPIGGKQV